MDLINIYMEMWYIYERTCETSKFQTSKNEIKLIWKQVEKFIMQSLSDEYSFLTLSCAVFNLGSLRKLLF